jgi:hypothetical protein
MFIEMALESLNTLRHEVPKWPPLVDGGPQTTTLDREVKELRMLGTRPDNLAGLALSDYERGYLLGLETARVMLSLRPDAVKAGVTL